MIWKKKGKVNEKSYRILETLNNYETKAGKVTKLEKTIKLMNRAGGD